MANPEHLEIIQQGTRAWNQWRKENENGVFDLRGAYLEEANLMGANLDGVNFTGANLDGAHLEEAILEQATLKEASLTGASLARANLLRATLSRAHLDGATLTGVNFTGTHLDGANFRGAHLYGANLGSINVSGADFTDVTIGRTIFTDTNLSTVKGLETIQHFGPSFLSVDTLIKSGNLPTVFLRGCGLDETFISYLPSLINQPIEFYSCFISYSHADKVFAKQLYDFLQGQGIRCWLDEHQMVPGQDIMEEIDRGIKLWDKVILCGSKNSLTSWWVDEEIGRAFGKEERLMRERKKKVLALIPLDLDGFMLKGWSSPHAGTIKRRLVGDFKGWKHDNAKMQAQFEQVLRALRTDGGREPEPPQLL